MVEILIYMALGAAFFHFCPRVAMAIYRAGKKAYNGVKDSVERL